MTSRAIAESAREPFDAAMTAILREQPRPSGVPESTASAAAEVCERCDQAETRFRRFVSTGDVSALRESVLLDRWVVRRLPARSVFQPGTTGDLLIALMALYGVERAARHLDEAIREGRRAWEVLGDHLLPPTVRAVLGGQLGLALVERAGITGDVNEIEETIRVVSAVSREAPTRELGYLVATVAARAVLLRFARRQDRDDVGTALNVATHAMKMSDTPVQTAGAHLVFTEALLAAYSLGEPQLLDVAEKAANTALDNAEDGSAEQAAAQCYLARILGERLTRS